MKIAIVAVAYNRCDSLQRLLISLEKAYYDKPVTLIISVDKSNTDTVERFADDYVWTHGEKIVDKHEVNLGLRPHMMSLGKWFDHFDAIAVLEDDIVVSPCFFYYASQAVEKYYNCSDIAGISLYGFSVNYQTKMPFIPLKYEYDVYFMNCAMSWGEVWMRDSWRLFYDWYIDHQDFPLLPQIPKYVCSWNNKSWLKYHTRYCIEENKYFVHPYVSLTTNYSDAGEHSAGSTVHQVPLQGGKKMVYYLPDLDGGAVYYDGFFENKELYNKLGLTEKELCLDLQNENHNSQKRRYWLTTEVSSYKIVRSYGLNYRPIENNVLLDNPGEDIFLYDTSIDKKNNLKKDRNRSTMLYNFHVSNMFLFVRKYGFLNLWKDLYRLLNKKIRMR